MGVKMGNKSNNKKANKPNNKSKKESSAPFRGASKDDKIVRINPGGYPMSGDAKKYALALQQPFSEAAIGCRVPDQYFCPTVTYAVREFLTIKADANGEADVVICPNPAVIAWSSRQSIQNGNALILKDGVQHNNSQYVNGTAFLASKLSAYRIVSWGVRIRSTQSINQTQGTVTAALVVPKDGLYFPSAGATNFSAIGGGFQAGGAAFAPLSLANYLVDAGFPSSGAGKIEIGSLVDYPYHMRSSCVASAENTYEISPKLTSPTAFHFRDSADSIFGTDTTGQTATVAITEVKTGDASYMLLDGWTNVVVAASGLVASSTGALDIEIVYNIEGNPVLAYGGAPAIGVATGAKSVHDPIGSLLAQAALEVAPAFRYVSAARNAFRAFSSSIQ